MILRSSAIAALVLAHLGCAKEGAATAGAPPPSAPATQIAAAAPSAAPASEEIAIGKPAPSFSVKASDGAQLSPEALKGKPAVVYFYPKDETPGCTKEACAFRDAWNELAKTNVVLIGVSADSDESHRAFSEHHKLPFHLVSDADGALAKRFGVPTFGRQSFVIGADGNVKKIYRSVNVSAHAQEILADLK